MLTLAKKLYCFKEPVLLLLFRVEEVLSNAPEESLAIGHRFKSLNDSFLGFWLRGFTSLKDCLHLKGSPRGDAKVQVHQGDQAKVSTLLYQVLLPVVEASAGERDIVKIIPERVINIKSSSIVCFLVIGIDLREGIYWAKAT